MFMHLAHSILSLLLLIPSLPPVGRHDGVQDDGKFFSADAIQSAERIIGQIQSDEHRDVLIETVAEIPQDLRDQFEQKGKTKFFQDWANARAKERGISGVYILICKNPSHLQAAVGNITQQKLFTIADRDELVRVLLRRFRQHQFDDGLLDAVKFIQQRMNSNSNDGTASGSGPVSTSSTRGLQPVVIAQLDLALLTCFGDSQ